MPSTARRSPLTPGALGAFFAISTAITGWTGASLLWAATPFQALWGIKPGARAALSTFAPWTGIGFLLLSLVMALASYGAFRRRRWGRRLALAIFIANALGDASRALDGAWAEAAVGVAVTGVIVWWLLRPPVRALFDA
jgi:hypothetical protein